MLKLQNDSAGRDPMLLSSLIMAPRSLRVWKEQWGCVRQPILVSQFYPWGQYWKVSQAVDAWACFAFGWSYQCEDKSAIPSNCPGVSKIFQRLPLAVLSCAISHWPHIVTEHLRRGWSLLGYPASVACVPDIKTCCKRWEPCHTFLYQLHVDIMIF